ncbi:MAG: exosortase C-terminal domain/associated protein EpsI [Steroidobacteraceae bacterium]
MSFRPRSLAISAAMLLTAVLAYAIAPTRQVAADSVALERMIPKRFGEWVEQGATLEQVSPQIGGQAGQSDDQSDGQGGPPNGSRTAHALYDQVLMRTYRRQSDGELVMLALAYGRRQVQEFKIHRPELCYYSQGYDVRFVGRSHVALGPHFGVDSNLLMTRNRARYEPVTYWIRVGDQISRSAWETRWLIFKDGISGSVPDGILVRASSVVATEADSASAFRVQKVFFADLYNSLSPAARAAIAGG